MIAKVIRQPVLHDHLLNIDNAFMNVGRLVQDQHRPNGEPFSDSHAQIATSASIQSGHLPRTPSPNVGDKVCRQGTSLVGQAKRAIEAGLRCASQSGIKRSRWREELAEVIGGNPS